MHNTIIINYINKYAQFMCMHHILSTVCTLYCILIYLQTVVGNVQQSKSYANQIAMLANNGYDKRDHFSYQ